MDIKQYHQANSADRRLPEIAIALTDNLMFRCPDGCNQNASIQFVRLESRESDDIKDEGELTFNLECPKCKKAYSYKIIFGPYDCHTGYGGTWEEQVNYWKKF